MKRQTEVAAPSNVGQPSDVDQPTEVEDLRAKCAALEARLAQLAEQKQARDTRKERVRRMMEMLDKFIVLFTGCGSHLGHRFTYEVFGSLVGWIMTDGSDNGWLPQDVDLRVWTAEGYETQARMCQDVDQLLGLMVLLTEGSDLQLKGFEKATAYNPEVRKLHVRKLKLAFRLNGEDWHNLAIDLVVAPSLPKPECSMTAWSLVRMNPGWNLAYRGTDRANVSGFLGALMDAQEEKKVNWLASIKGVQYPYDRYLLGRFGKLYVGKGLQVSNTPFKVANAPLPCAVCMDTKSNALVHSCGHTTCVECASQLRQPKCPECRSSIFPYLRPDAKLPARTQRLIEEATARQDEGSAVSA